MKYLYIILIALLFGACCPKIIPVSNNTTTTKDSTTTVTPKDSTFEIAPKIIHIHHQVNCDSLGKAQMKKKVVKKDGMTGTGEVKDGQMIVTCQADAYKLKIKWLEKRYSVLEKTKTVQVNNVEVYKMYWWQKVLMWIGIIYLFVTGLWIGFVVLKHSLIP